MPFKERLNTGLPRARKKQAYKVTNWPEYNKSLKSRGKLTLYMPYGDLKLQFINEEPYIPGVSGQQATYKDGYIELMFTFYILFNWGMRQITGYFEDLWEMKGLNIPVPSFGHLSDLFSAIPLKTRHYCEKVAKRLSRGESINLILDSTGFKFGKASHWYQTKYGKPCENTPWRKFHLSMDPNMEMYETEVTTLESSDIEIMSDLIPEGLPIDKVTADGAYYSKEGVEKMYNEGITPVIPPPKHAVVHGLPTTRWHDKIVQYIKDKGTVYAFHKKYDYGLRALVEAQISRIKRCIENTFRTQKLESQKREGIIIGNIINKWNSFGQCVCVKTG